MQKIVLSIEKHPAYVMILSIINPKVLKTEINQRNVVIVYSHHQ
jgi:hypothetical protein